MRLATVAATCLIGAVLGVAALGALGYLLWLEAGGLLPGNDAAAGIRTLLATFIAGALALGILGAAAAAWIGRRLRGLQAVETAVQALSAGRLDTRIGLPRHCEIGRLAALIDDMTAQRQHAEAALTRSQENFRQIAENINEVFWLSAPDKTEMIYVSPSYETIWQRRRADLYARPQSWLDAVHPDDRDVVAAASLRQIQGDYRWRYRILRPDGSARWISDRAFPVRRDDGSVHRIAGLAQDVTEQVEAELSLRERLKELGCLYRVLELTTGAELNVAQACQAIADLLPGAWQHESVAVARIRTGADEYRSTAWQEPVAVLTSMIDAGDGVPRSLEVGYVEPRADALDGEGPFLAEERALLDGVAAHLARMLQARYMAESLNQAQRLDAVGQLTGGVAHDFNNQLTVILGNAELLREQLEAGSDHATIATSIGAAAQRGAELTQQLLAFARRQPLEPRAVDVNRQLAGLDTMLRRTLGEHIDIVFARGGGIWEAMVDPARLDSALVNLALNARDAMPRGGKLTIETANVHLSNEYATRHTDLTPGQYVLLAVSDTGTGIAPEDLPRVFEPFYTTRNAGPGRRRGTGLGLSMVYGFAKQSRGDVHIYSEPGEGTTVKLYLPRAVAARTEAAVPAPAIPGSGDECVLLVEDDPLVREFAGAQLEELGYRVRSAGSGAEALAALERRPDVDLLFTDVVMPGGMSGRELAEAVRERHPHVRVLYTSGYTENAVLHHGRLEPGVRLLSKPYRRAELAAAVRQALSAA